ncbi:two-component system sensor histidine kinase/response regulator [Burkholderia lata]|uniref:ATP-binding protein n=1 Tax=Burkholderia lata (strain ATCC 17760 / DSM 23089 / LMG 22485 / NCIMB 9086 / R18194 / 383) TaxID=482957 RepID=UPI001453836F|nr:ATP-binding protein [Burkholderia lata]VWB06058.1 two-component system sensor histidine kinase/response regulator [Burkholderia lata]
MPYSPLQSIRRYQNISVFGGGIVVTILILIACALGMGSIVYGYLDGERHNFLTGMVQTLNEIKVSETSFRNGVTNAQLIWRETAPAPDGVVDAFYEGGERAAIKPYPSVVFGVSKQPADRTEVARYLSLSVLLARICAASSINRGQTLVGYHYSTRTSLLGLVPDSGAGGALETPESRARVMEALRIDFGAGPAQVAGSIGRPHVRWLPPFNDPISGAARIRLAAQAQVDGEPFAVLVTEYAPEHLLSWQPEHPVDGAFFITTGDNRLVAASPGVAGDEARIGRLLALDPSRDNTKPEQATFRDGFVIFHGTLDATGWMLAYALPWADVVANVAWRASLLLGASLLTIAIMWILLVRFHRRVFASVYARSQRVFDSEALCRSVIETAPIGLGLISRADGHFMLVSPALAEMLARLGSDYRALSAQAVARYDAFIAGGAAGGSLQTDFVLADADAGATPLHLEVSACGARYQEIDVLIVAVADVTARRQLVQQLEEAVRAADSANAAKSSFLAAITHEIRTPLNVILGNLELLARSALDASQHGRVQTLRTAASGLLTLVSDILDFSKIEAGAMTVEAIEFDVIGVIERTLGAFAPVAKAKALSLFCEVDASDTQQMRGDPTRLGQVLGNLLSNAIKFTASGHVLVRVSVASAGCGGAELSIAVEDTGIGIAGADRHKLFKAFSQVDASITRRYGGTGLGLALCDRLAAAMSGRIDVASVPGTGSRFTLTLPLGMAVVPLDAHPARGARVPLIVVARTEWQRFALSHLRAWGFDVDAYERPARIPADRRARAAAIVLLGDSDAWSRAELDSLGGGCPVVLATPDGPPQAYRAGRTIRVSSYALGGLKASLVQALADTGGPAVQRLTGTPAEAVRPGARRVVLAGLDSVGSTLLREQLHVLDCEVQAAGSAEAALGLMASGAWHVLLVDAGLPDMSVSTLANAVHALGVDCDVMVVTSHVAPDDGQRYADAGIGCVLTKPVTLAHLRGALAGLGRRRGVLERGEGIQKQDIAHFAHGDMA